ncbi:hypothetical protein Aph01nite_39100 [Acrocarpospora phusangensis]|uniref:Uncharacterized protein n=1 Tax=Acrocarpospora phusangensis TaxID=1070424 RepID=A0A919QFL4_9ACTN|nr:hypothetical protein [Acrocarpospora phusangensis]GIH25600.1 hypothetical protein Aph01nite_39100 [Acrocarpospora phusangensis]
MTDELETGLRATLSHAARSAPVLPDGLAAQLITRSRRRRARARSLAAGLALVAIAVPAGLVARDRPEGDVSTATAAETQARREPDPYVLAMAGLTPLGRRLIVLDPSEDAPMLLWFARDAKGATLFCTANRNRAGGSFYGCDEAARSSIGVGSTSVIAGEVLYYGATDADVTSMAAVAADGKKIPGTVTRVDGTPWRIWTVTVPGLAAIGSFELTGARGQVVNRIEHHGSVAGELTAPPVGPAEEMPHGLVVTLVTTPDETLIWRLNGQPMSMNLVRPADLLTDLGGHAFPVSMTSRGARWYGIAQAGTARVDLVLPDGTTATATARPDRWGIGVSLFSGVYRHGTDIYQEGFELVGYDEAGTVLWRDPQPAVPPLWQ